MWINIFLIFLLIKFIYAINPFPRDNWKTGFINLGNGNHLFYYLFKCRNLTIKDPSLVVWLQGGPGCSTSLSVFSEGGPYVVNNKTSDIEYNQFAWNSIADTLFIDQPAGTHFSYSTNNDSICQNENCVANDFYIFLQNFIQLYPEYKGRKLYISGISYGGHYVPAISAKLIKENNPDFNLQGMAIANGLIDLYTQLPSYPLFLFQNKLISRIQYLIFRLSVFICKIADLLRINEHNFFDWTCNYSFFTFYDAFIQKYDKYDTQEEICPYTVYENKAFSYLNQKDVQNSLGVSQYFHIDNLTVWDKLKSDWKTSLKPEVELVLSKKLKVILFFGEADYVCNWIGGEWVANSLNWTGNQGFNQEKYQDFLAFYFFWVLKLQNFLVDNHINFFIVDKN